MNVFFCRTNLGKEAMTMPGFPFESFESYVTHVDVVNYLQMCFDNVNGEKYTKVSIKNESTVLLK